MVNVTIINITVIRVAAIVPVTSSKPEIGNLSIPERNL